MRRWSLPICALVLVAGAAACATGPGHPVHADAPPIPASAWPPPSPALPEPAPVEGEAARQALMAGLDGLYTRLLAVRARATTGREPAILRLPAVERSVRRRYRDRRAPGGPVHHVVVAALAGHVPLPPAAVADLFGDPAVERAVLAAQTFRRIDTRFALPAHRRERFWVEKLRVGAGPFRHDLRFAVAVERMALGDGRVAMRYDPIPARGTTGVSLYRGLLLVEPVEEGSRVTEVIVLGTALQAAPPFDRILGNLVYETLRHRATNLWVRAWS